jgi:hypothetical protein
LNTHDENEIKIIMIFIYQQQHLITYDHGYKKLWLKGKSNTAYGASLKANLLPSLNKIINHFYGPA